MRLVTTRIFAQRWFDPACRPDNRTLHGWVKRQELPGRIINGAAYVDEAAWLGSTGNALADKILSSDKRGRKPGKTTGP